jgi:hypothetical protein
MAPDDIRAALRPFNLKAVAADLGISYLSLWRFARGKTKNPTWALVDAVSRYLQQASGK